MGGMTLVVIPPPLGRRGIMTLERGEGNEAGAGGEEEQGRGVGSRPRGVGACPVTAQADGNRGASGGAALNDANCAAESGSRLRALAVCVARVWLRASESVP